MSLRDELVAARVASGRHCLTCAWIAQQDEADEWNALMTDKTVKARELFLLAVKHGYKGSESSMRTHRTDHNDAA